MPESLAVSSCGGHRVGGTASDEGRTVSIGGKFDDISNADVDDAEKALVLLLELLLVKDLHAKYRGVLDLDIEGLVPVPGSGSARAVTVLGRNARARVHRLLDSSCCHRLIPVHRDDSERIR